MQHTLVHFMIWYFYIKYNPKKWEERNETADIIVTIVFFLRIHLKFSIAILKCAYISNLI